MKKVKKFTTPQDSVYCALGFKDHEDMIKKANLITELSTAIKKKKLTQTKAATLLNISQPKLSQLLNGQFRDFPAQRLMDFIGTIQGMPKTSS